MYLKSGDSIIAINNNNTILELDKKYKIKNVIFIEQTNKYYLTLVGHNYLIYKVNRFKLDIKTLRIRKLEKLEKYESV